MWALIEEQASNRAHKHWDRNWELWMRYSSGGVWSPWHLPEYYWLCPLTRLQSANMSRDQTLMVNMLWEVAYGVCHEVLHLDSLEDFNVTKADLMDLKKDILAMWDSRDRCRTLSLGPTFTPSSASANEKGSTLGKTSTPARASASASGPFVVLVTALGKTLSPLLRPLAPTTGDSTSLSAPILYAGYLAQHQATLWWEHPWDITFDPMMGWPLKPLVPSTYPSLSQPLGVSFSTPISLDVAGLSALSGLSREECPLVVGSPSCSSRVVVGWENTYGWLSPHLQWLLRVSTSCANVMGDVHRDLTAPTLFPK